MDKSNYEIKIGFVRGLQEVVGKEVEQKTTHKILTEEEDFMYLDYKSSFTEVLQLKSIGNASLVVRDKSFNPSYLSKHKGILKDLINEILIKSEDKFKTFRISCAGQDSPEVIEISNFIENEFKLLKEQDADLKINIYKNDSFWELSIQLTARPLSYRKYKVANMSGAMDPNIAFALNYYCGLEEKRSYLNIFSGSATLLIEACLEYQNLENVVGFDYNKKNLSLGYQNVKKSGLIKKIKLFEYDIFDKPDLGKFDVIVADLPFGMVISKGEDLKSVYGAFLEYAFNSLNEDGVVGVYTSEHETFSESIDTKKWKIQKIIELKLVTNVNSYLYPKIIVCKKK